MDTAAPRPSPRPRLPWHAGRTVGKTLYAGDGPDDLVGMMMTPDLAALVVQRVNGYQALVAALDILLASCRPAVNGGYIVRAMAWERANDALRAARENEAP